MAWDATIPDDDELLVNFPALCRSNWSAIATGTDSSLLITNAKISASAAIADSKLAQITTPAKVSGAALTSLASIPSGAGVIPDTSNNNKLAANATDTSPEYFDSLINTSHFQIASDKLELKDGGVETEKLESGSASPGNSKYYGTNGSGTKGFFDLPTDSDEKVKASSGDSAGYLDAKVDASTIEVSSNKLQVKDQGITSSKIKKYETGSATLLSATTERTIASTSWTKVKEFKLGGYGTVTVQWDMKCSATDSVTAIFVNGSQVSGNYTDTVASTYQTKTYDCTVTPGDLAQIYGKDVGGGIETIYVRNAYIKVTDYTMESVEQD